MDVVDAYLTIGLFGSLIFFLGSLVWMIIDVIFFW